MNIERLQELIELNPETGELTWKPRGVPQFDTRFAGTPALAAVDSQGYRGGTLECKKQRAHRVVWALYNQVWPENMIDHIDGDKLNNRPENLRQVTNSVNQRNKSGVKGIDFHKHSGKWRASVTDPQRRLRQKYFETREAARQWRDRCYLAWGYGPNHGAGDRIRTCDELTLTDYKSVPFNHLGTPA